MVKIWEVEGEWVKKRGNRVHMGAGGVKMEEKRIQMGGIWGRNTGGGMG